MDLFNKYSLKYGYLMINLESYEHYTPPTHPTEARHSQRYAALVLLRVGLDERFDERAGGGHHAQVLVVQQVDDATCPAPSCQAVSRRKETYLLVFEIIIHQITIIIIHQIIQPLLSGSQ